jgi:hypothetical protein
MESAPVLRTARRLCRLVLAIMMQEIRLPQGLPQSYGKDAVGMKPTTELPRDLQACKEIAIHLTSTWSTT